MIRFICGCTMKAVAPLTEEVFSTHDSIVIDSDGFMICLIHRERRVGWRSLPTFGGRPEYKFSSWTPLEIERYLYWDEKPVRTISQLIGFTRMEDRRDNRDPALLGAEILAKKNGEPIPPPTPPPPPEELTMVKWPTRGNS